MLKKTIQFTDYKGTVRTEDFYFNLTKAEALEMQLSVSGGLSESLELIVSKLDAPAIMKTFKEMILKSYGEMSPDGRRFVKNNELREAFEQTEAYSEFYYELVTNGEAAAAFLKGVMPDIPDAPDTTTTQIVE